MKWPGTTRSGVAGGEPEPRAPERSLAWLRLAIVLAALLPAAFFAAAARVGYLEAIQAAQNRLDELARAAEEHSARMLERNDVVMQQMLRLLGDDDDETLRRREPQLYELATTILLRLPHIASLSVFSAQGELLMSTLFPPASRIPGGAEWRLFAERTLDVVLTVSKPRELRSGAIGGSLELRLNRAHFEEFYRRLTEGDQGLSVLLLNAEGALMSSWPEKPSSAAEHLSAFRRVGEGRLYVAVTQDLGAALAGWRHQMMLLGALLLPVTLALVGASWLVLRRTRREIDARRLLSDEAAHRARAEDALRQAQKLDALGQLAGGLAHDFNNLLMVVSANAELLARNVPQAAARSELASILHAVEGGSKLTRRLLRFSRKRAQHPDVVQPETALQAMLPLLRTTAGKAIEIALQVEPQTPPIEVDVSELEMALINLVANARDAMAHKGRIRIHARPGRPGEGPEGAALGYAVISVADTGQGMSPEILNRVFEPFFTTKPPDVGTGLGLAQVYGFCVQAGGYVEVASTLRVGTTVSMLLPASAKSIRALQPASAHASRLSARVLLVEDNPELASSLAASLEKSGCSVTPVGSVQEAERLALAAGSGFDVVLSDIVMPGADGIALANRLRKRKPDLPVVLITGYSREVRHAVSADMEVLTKPCTAQELVGALSRAIAAHRPASPMH
jgi:two-component system NtrC family sensor kinase